MLSENEVLSGNVWADSSVGRMQQGISYVGNIEDLPQARRSPVETHGGRTRCPALTRGVGWSRFIHTFYQQEHGHCSRSLRFPRR